MSELAVFDDSGSAVPKGGGSHGSHPKRSKKNWAIMAAIVVLILAVPVTYYVYRKTHSKKVVSKVVKVVNNKVCTTNKDRMQKSVVAIEKKEIPELNGIVETIKKIPNYETDQNCLAIIAWWHILKGESNQAKTYSSKISAIYKKESDSTIGNVYTSDPDKINKSIGIIEVNQKVNNTQANYQPSIKQ